MYCVLDIESTGGPFGKEAIMEIALFKFDGSEIVDQLISLVHPHREIQKYVSKITGITPKMLARAPRFHEIAKRILELTEGSILVGHNAEFDYRMLRQEFGRLGYPFEMKTLDTIPLTEKLIPGLASYGLDRVCEELGIHRGQKHRAEGDARATLDLLILLLEKDQEKDISILNQSIQNSDPLKDKIQDIKRSVKFNRGVFYLHDKEGKLLYLGTSDNIKSAINRLFIAENKLAKKLADEVYSVNTESTGNWLVSQIKKLEERRKAQPKFNKIRDIQFGYAITEVTTRKGEKELKVLPLNEVAPDKVIVKVSNLKSAYRAIRMLRRNRSADQINEMLELLLNFPKNAIYSAKGRSHKEKCAFIVENSDLVGYHFYKLNDELDHMDRLSKSMARINHNPKLIELLKLGVLSGEFQAVNSLQLES